jgi:hypothetical protein
MASSASARAWNRGSPRSALAAAHSVRSTTTAASTRPDRSRSAYSPISASSGGGVSQRGPSRRGSGRARYGDQRPSICSSKRESKTGAAAHQSIAPQVAATVLGTDEGNSAHQCG